MPTCDRSTRSWASNREARRPDSRLNTTLRKPQTTGDRELTAPLLAQLDGFEIGRVASREPTLEDAYIALVTAA